MSEIVEWIMRMKDEVSLPLDKSAKQSEKTRREFDKLRKSEIGLGKVMKSTGKSAHDLENELRKLKQQRDLIPPKFEYQLRKTNVQIERMEGNLRRVRALGKSKNSASGSGASMFDDILGGIPGMGMLANPFAMVGGAVLAGGTAMVKQGAKNEYSRTQFSNEFGAGNGYFLDQLKNQRGILGDGAVSQGTSLKRAGFSNHQAVSTLGMLGDLANGDEGKLQTLVDVLAQIKREGKLTESTFASLRDNGFNPLLDISEQTGASFGDLLEDLEAGEIGANDVVLALQAATAEGGKFFGNLDRLADTSTGSWNKLTNSISGLFSEVSDFTSGAGSSFFESLDSMVLLKRAQLHALKGELSGDDNAVQVAEPIDTKNYSRSDHKTLSDFLSLTKLPGTAMTDVQSPFALDKTKEERFAEAEAKKAADDEAQKQQDRINAVSGGGVRNVTIHIGKMIETIENNFANGEEEYADKLEMDTTEAIYRSLLSASGR